MGYSREKRGDRAENDCQKTIMGEKVYEKKIFR